MQKYNFMKNLRAVLMPLCVSVCMVSCSGLVDAIFGDSDNPSGTTSDKPETPEVEKKVVLNTTGATITAESAEEATALIKSLVDDIKVKGVGDGKEYKIELAGDAILSSSDITIEIPQVDGAHLNLVFEEAFDAGTTLNVNADDTSSEPGKASNTLVITLPPTASADELSLNVNMPETTVTLKSSGAQVSCQDVKSRTALTTLVIDDQVEVDNMEVQGGTVQVNEGGILDKYVFAAEHNEDRVYITEDGGVEPIKVSGGVDENGNPIELWQIASEDGNPYYATSLKIIKGKADYSIVWFTNPSYGTIPLKTVIVGDGAVLRTNWVAMENIEGEGKAEIKYRLTHTTGYTDDTEYGGDKFYEFNSDMSGVKNVKNILFSQPEIEPDPDSCLPELEEKKAEGYIMHEPRLNLDVDGVIDGCTFMFNHVHFCPEISVNCPTVKNTKFVHVESNIIGDKNQVEIRMPYNHETSNSIAFDGCEFSSNTEFMFFMFLRIGDTLPEGEMDFTGYLDFTNCKIDGKDFTGEDTSVFTRMGILKTGTKIIISFNGEPKYECFGQIDPDKKLPILIPIEESGNKLNAPNDYPSGGVPFNYQSLTF